MALDEFLTFKYFVAQNAFVGTVNQGFEGRQSVYVGTSTDPYNVGLADGDNMAIAAKYFSYASMDIYAFKNMGTNIQATYVAWNLRYFAGDGDKIACWSTTVWAHHSGTTSGSMATIGAHWKLYWDESPQRARVNSTNWHNFVNPLIYYDWLGAYDVAAGIERIRIFDLDRTAATIDLFPGTRICKSNPHNGTSVMSTLTFTGVNAYYKLFNPGWVMVMGSYQNMSSGDEYDMFGFWAMDMPGFTSVGTGTSIIATLYLEI